MHFLETSSVCCFKINVFYTVYQSLRTYVVDHDETFCGRRSLVEGVDLVILLIEESVNIFRFSLDKLFEFYNGVELVNVTETNDKIEVTLH